MSLFYILVNGQAYGVVGRVAISVANFSCFSKNEDREYSLLRSLASGYFFSGIGKSSSGNLSGGVEYWEMKSGKAPEVRK